MPRPPEKAIDIPELSSFIYQLMKELRPEKKQKVSDRFIKYFATDSSMKGFAQRASLDKQIQFMGEVGIDFYMIFAPNPDVAAMSIFASAAQYDDESFRVDLVTAMKQNKVFMIGSREIATKLAITAQNPSTRIYSMTKAATDITANIGDFRKMESYGSKLNKATEAHKAFARIQLETLNSEQFLEGSLNIDKKGIRTLLALYLHQNTAVTTARLEKYLSGRNTVTKKTLDELETLGLIFNDGQSKSKVHYLITTEGIKRVHEYISMVRNKTFEE